MPLTFRLVRPTLWSRDVLCYKECSLQSWPSRPQMWEWQKVVDDIRSHRVWEIVTELSNGISESFRIWKNWNQRKEIFNVFKMLKANLGFWSCDLIYPKKSDFLPLKCFYWFDQTRVIRFYTNSYIPKQFHVDILRFNFLLELLLIISNAMENSVFKWGKNVFLLVFGKSVKYSWDC